MINPSDSSEVIHTTEIGVTQCNSSYFEEAYNLWTQTKILDKLLCLDFEEDSQVFGEEGYDLYSYIEIKIESCGVNDQNFTCHSNAEIQDYFVNRRFSIVFINKMFESRNFVQPIQTYLDFSASLYLNPGQEQLSEIYIQEAETHQYDYSLNFWNNNVMPFLNVQTVKS